MERFFVVFFFLFPFSYGLRRGGGFHSELQSGLRLQQNLVRVARRQGKEIVFLWHTGSSVYLVSLFVRCWQPPLSPALPLEKSRARIL